MFIIWVIIVPVVVVIPVSFSVGGILMEYGQVAVLEIKDRLYDYMMNWGIVMNWDLMVCAVMIKDLVVNWCFMVCR